MNETRAVCHHLMTMITMWGGGTEWYVKRVDGKFIAEPGDIRESIPPPCSSVEEALRVWSEWFKCQRG